jgi:hypothetical protein
VPPASCKSLYSLMVVVLSQRLQTCGRSARILRIQPKNPAQRDAVYDDFYGTYAAT